MMMMNVFDHFHDDLQAKQVQLYELNRCSNIIWKLISKVARSNEVSSYKKLQIHYLNCTLIE